MRSDVLVIGGGHNGLVASFYLARAGLRTRVLERRSMPGGACVTEELWPGFRVSRAAYVVGLLRPRVARELDLGGRGLRFLSRDPSSFTPLAEGGGLTLGADPVATREAIGRLSRRDAERYPRYEALLDRIARAVDPLLDAPPPDPARPRRGDWRLAAHALRSAWRLRGELTQAARLMLGSARATLEGWFESEPLRATLATDAVIGAWASPSTPGTGYVLFHHVMGEVPGGGRGVWAYVEGGMGRLSETLADAARGVGAEIRTDAPVARILVEDGRALGAELEDGTRIDARCVVSAADPARTLLGLVGEAQLPDAFARELKALDFRSPVCKINLALDRLPRFRGTADGLQPHHGATIHLGATTLDALDASFRAAESGALPELPMIELTLPSALDRSLAPAGQHVASLFVQHVPWEPAGSSWDAEREPFADRVLACIEAAAPGFSSSVLHREVLVPPDLERIFGLTGGNIFHGAMTLDRLFSLRPLPGWARYRTPIQGLWLCGAGTHPGGGVMGACGRNAAREILRELRP